MFDPKLKEALGRRWGLSTVKMIYSPLYMNNADGINWFLAKDCEVSDDNKTYTFSLISVSLRYRSFAAKRKIEFVKKSAGVEKRNREIGSFFSLRAMGALTGASPERA